MSPKKYFGTDGVRGKVGGEIINAEFALRLGYAAGKVLAKEHSARRGRLTVLIGKDTRISGYICLGRDGRVVGWTFADPCGSLPDAHLALGSGYCH
jgi:phosphomannomutase